MTSLVLHDYFRSSASYRVRIALNLKGLAYERVEVSLIAGEQRSDAYLELNAQGFVPMLVADGEPIIQSMAIIDWLDRAFPEPRLIPEAAMPRAVALAQAQVVASDIHPLNNLRVLKYLTKDLGLNEQTKDRWIATWIAQGFEALEAMAGDGTYLGGDTPSIADCCLVPQMYNARRFEVPLDDYPRLVAIDAACLELKAFRNAHPDAVQSTTLIEGLSPGIGARIENRLRDEAGIVQFRRSDGRSANPTSQGVTLRGLGGNASSRALVTLDGIPQADPFGGWVAWSAYDALNLRGVTITRGGGSGADGPGALAGTIGLHSDLTYGGTASLAYGSRDSWDASASVGGELGSGEVAVDRRYSRGDGFIPIAKGQRGGVDRAAPYEQGGLGVRLRFDAGDSSRIEASVRGFSDRRDRGTDFTASKVDGIDASLRFIHDPYRANQLFALAYVQLRDFESGFASVAANRNSVAPALFQRVPATGLGARVEFRPLIGRANPLRIGADWRRTTGRTKEDFFFAGTVPGRHRTAGGDSDTVGAFAEWTSGYRDYGLVWTVSGRVDRWWLGEGYRNERNIGGPVITDLRFAARRGWEGSGRAGVQWTKDALSLRAAGYRGWRLPTLNELYRPFRVGAEVTTANEMLKPERLWGGEVGFDWKRDDTKLSATLFVNHLTNAIANVTLAPNLNQRQNLDAIDSKGVEVSAEQKIDFLTLRATYAFTDATVDAAHGAVALDGRRPAQIAKHGGSISLRSNASGPLGGFATLRYVGKQNEDDLGLLVLGDALTLDAGLTWRLADAISLEARGENLFDELVPAAISSAGIVERATPRTLWIGARVSF